MARKEPTKSLKVATSLADRAATHADRLGWSYNRFAEHAVEMLCAMIEDPAKRTVPEVVIMLDALKRPREMLRYQDLADDGGKALLAAEEGEPKTRRGAA